MCEVTSDSVVDFLSLQPSALSLQQSAAGIGLAEGPTL